MSSAGVEANSGTPYLPEVVEVARRWGLEIADGYSISIIEQGLPTIDTRIVCAEEYMGESIASLGFKGEIVCYENIVPDPSFMPRDPVGYRGRALESELAKVAFANIWGARNYDKNLNVHDITVIVPEGERNVDAAIDRAFTEANYSGALVIDGDLRSPIIREIKNRNLRVGPLTDGIDHLEFDLLSNFIEHQSPERTLLDPSWGSRIRTIANVRPVVIITAPQLISSGPLPDCYLAAAVANRVIIIR